MTIAVHMDTFKDDSFLWNCISRLSLQNANDHFIIFTEEKKLPPPAFGSNCTPVIISPAIKNSLLLHYWYNYKLPALLKKYNAAVFISQTGAVSLRTTIPQVMIMADDFLWYKNRPVKNEYARYLKKYFLKFAEKVSAVCVTKPFIGQRLISRYAALQHKTTTILNGLNNVYSPLAPPEKEGVLEKYTGGHEYFICECSAFTQENIITVLKAFSIFKKRLKSSMQLVILNSPDKNPVKDFHLYKYRQEVHLITASPLLMEAQIIAAAYAAIYIPAFISATNWGLHCMACHVPLLTVTHEAAQTLYEDAALYSSINEKTIAENMMLLYKDETLRNNYIQKGAALASRYNWHDSSVGLWQTILQHSRV